VLGLLAELLDGLVLAPLGFFGTRYPGSLFALRCWPGGRLVGGAVVDVGVARRAS
jgi:hypothetical protein